MGHLHPFPHFWQVQSLYCGFCNRTNIASKKHCSSGNCLGDGMDMAPRKIPGATLRFRRPPSSRLAWLEYEAQYPGLRLGFVTFVQFFLKVMPSLVLEFRSCSGSTPDCMMCLCRIPSPPFLSLLWPTPRPGAGHGWAEGVGHVATAALAAPRPPALPAKPTPPTPALFPAFRGDPSGVLWQCLQPSVGIAVPDRDH